MRLFNLFILLLLWSTCQSQYLIPYPASVKTTGRQVAINNRVLYVKNPTVVGAMMDVIKAEFRQQKGIELRDAGENAQAAGSVLEIQLTTDTGEAYTLEISKDQMVISGGMRGVFYGLHTLLQWIDGRPAEPTVKEVQIRDLPQYAWRGIHLDVSRHFFSVDYIKKYISLMASLKFNTFHWHLTDDQGWRIEIKKYPRLTQEGAWRSGSMIGAYEDGRYDTLRYGGFYTQEEIKEVVRWATMHQITIVPEIEMPGHARAALAAYPQFSCTGQTLPVERQWGVFDEVFCAGKNETYGFLEDVLTEVIALFPGAWIHVGGDECPKGAWKKCPSCQKLMKEQGIKDEHELQSYFITRMGRYIASKGKKLIGWDEILEGGLPEGAAVMSWRGIEGAKEAVSKGQPAVLTPGSHCYFDHYQGNPDFEPISIGGHTTVSKVYSFSPTEGIPAEKHHLILGGQANLWTEYVLHETQADYMMWARASAMAEALWLAPSQKNIDRFWPQHDAWLKHMQGQNIRVAHSGFRPEFTRINGPFNRSRIEVSTPAPLPFKASLWQQNRKIIEKSTQKSFGKSAKRARYRVLLPTRGDHLIIQYGLDLRFRDTIPLVNENQWIRKIQWDRTNAATIDSLRVIDGWYDFNGQNRKRYARISPAVKWIELELKGPKKVKEIRVWHRVDREAGLQELVTPVIKWKDASGQFQSFEYLERSGDSRKSIIKLKTVKTQAVRIYLDQTKTIAIDEIEVL